MADPEMDGWRIERPAVESRAAVQPASVPRPVGVEAAEVVAARNLAAQAAAVLPHSAAFQSLDPSRQSALLRDVDTLARALETPADLMQRRFGARPPQGAPQPSSPAPQAAPSPQTPSTAATAAIAARAGALTDEIDFPGFVAGLVHSTFDAIVDSTIRQMEAFASLVSAVAKDVDRFTRENITPNQVRDWLIERYPNELELDPASRRSGRPRLRRRTKQPDDQEDASATWLADFGLGGGELTDDLIEEQLVPAARNVVGEQRLQMLATMVLMGMSRVVVRDGSISARLRFRAVARDKAAVDYAVSQDPGSGGWGSRGSAATVGHTTMVSTVTANVQTDSMLDANLFGEVKINFASETLPLDRFADAASMVFLQRNSRPVPPGQAPALPANQAPPMPPAPPTTPTGGA